MAKTLNLQLNLEENGETKFEIWRKSIDGNNLDSEKSNMQILDEVIGEIQKALKLSSSNLDKYKSEVAERIQNTNTNIDLVKQSYTSKIDFDTKVEEINASKASKTEVTEAINASKQYTDDSVQSILGGDIEEVYETIKEIQDLLESDVSQTGNILENISKNKEDIANLKNADISINERITTETNNRVYSVNNLTERIENEENARQNSDTSISNRINEVVERIENETTERENSDKIINNQISNINSTLNNKANVGDLDDLEKEVETKANQSDLNTLTGKVDELEEELGNKANKTELTQKIDKTEFEEAKSEINQSITLVQGNIGLLGDKIYNVEQELDKKADKTELDEKADKSELENTVKKEDLSPIVLTPSSTREECMNALSAIIETGRTVVYAVSQDISVMLSVVKSNYEAEDLLICGGYYYKDNKSYFCGFRSLYNGQVFEHFNEEVTTNTESGQILIEVKNIQIEEVGEGRWFGTATITDEDKQHIVNNFSNTVLYANGHGGDGDYYVFPSEIYDGAYIYTGKNTLGMISDIIVGVSADNNDVAIMVESVGKDRIIELTNIEEAGEDAYTANISFDDLDLIRSDFNGTKLRFVVDEVEIILAPKGKNEEEGNAVYLYSATISNLMGTAHIIEINGEIAVVVKFQTLIDTEDLKQQNVINENTFASKDYVDEKIEQIETVKGDKGDKGDTGRGIASITMENGNFIVHYTDGTRQEIVNEQDYIYEFIPVDGTYIENDYENAGGWGIKVEGTLPPAYSLIVTTDFFESLEVLSGIAVYGFANQSNLLEIEIRVPTISAYAFQECGNLTKVLIGQEVRNIGAYAFNLTSVGEQNGVLQFEGNSYLLKTKIWSSSSMSKLYIHRNAFDTDEIYFYCLGDNTYVKVYWDSNGNIDAINV